MKVAFVIPWFHANISGGAETQCREAAHLLQGFGHDVTILTTGIRDHGSDWNENHFPPGPAREGDLQIIRFPADRIDRQHFNGINTKYLAMNDGEKRRLAPEEEEKFFSAMAPSRALLAYLEKDSSRYDFVIFLPYLFATSLFGPAICGERSVLLPCLHDEGYAYSRLVARAFADTGAVIFNTAAEKDLAGRLFPSLPSRQAVIGDSIELGSCRGDGAAFRKSRGIDGPFILCLGRRDRTKRTDLLVSYFREYRKDCRRPVSLVLAGPGEIRLPPGPGIHDLGFLSADEKYGALAACEFLCNPSLNESFSIVLLEAWANGRPALVASGCAPTLDLCRRSGGGLWFDNFTEFSRACDFLLAEPERAQDLGARGRRFTERRYSSQVIGRKYHETFTAWQSGQSPPLARDQDGAGESTVLAIMKRLAASSRTLPEPAPVSLAPPHSRFAGLRSFLGRLLGI